METGIKNDVKSVRTIEFLTYLFLDYYFCSNIINVAELQVNMTFFL